MRIGCAVVSDCLSEFLELSLSNYLGLVADVRRTFFFTILPFGADYDYDHEFDHETIMTHLLEMWDLYNAFNPMSNNLFHASSK